MAVYYGLHYSPRRAGRHRSQSARGHNGAKLDGPLRPSRSASVRTGTHRTVPLLGILLYLDLPTDMPGADAHRRVSVGLFSFYANAHDGGDMPKYVSRWADETRA